MEVHRERGQNFSIFISRRYLLELGPWRLGLPVADSTRFCPTFFFSENPHTHENKIGVRPPPPPKKKRKEAPPLTNTFVGMEVFIQKEPTIPGAYKIGAAISSPRVAGGKKSMDMRLFREKQRGVENSGEGKAYHETPPQKRFWTLLPMIRFPPPLCSRHVILLRENGRRPDKSHFLRPPKVVLEGSLYSTFPPPPPNRTFMSIKTVFWEVCPPKLPKIA